MFRLLEVPLGQQPEEGPINTLIQDEFSVLLIKNGSSNSTVSYPVALLAEVSYDIVRFNAHALAKLDGVEVARNHSPIIWF